MEHGAGPDQRFRIRRFDADRTDAELSWDQALRARPTGRQLLWLDVEGHLDPAQTAALAKRFELAPRTQRALDAPVAGPYLGLHGAYFHVRIATEPDAQRPDQVRWLDIIAGENVVISRHVEPIGFLSDFDDRIEADTTMGLIDAPGFVTALLDSSVTTYFAAADAMEDEVDGLDARSLRRDGAEDVLTELVALRRRISRLRRVLTDHRDLFSSLATPDFAQATGLADTSAYQSVATRFGAALAAVEDAREVLLGSFDVYMTRTAQRTNDVVKILALATVLLLPGTLVAGLLGMNVTVPLSKDDPMSFWIALGAILILAVSIVGVARIRRWL